MPVAEMGVHERRPFHHHTIDADAVPVERKVARVACGWDKWSVRRAQRVTTPTVAHSQYSCCTTRVWVCGRGCGALDAQLLA